MTHMPPTIDMLPNGQFRTPPRPAGIPFTMKLAAGAALVAIIGGSLAVAAFAIWFVSMILPVVLIAGGVAYAALRFRRWRLLRSQGSASVSRFGRFS